jgi:outer membrane protein assembly factor BamB
MQGFLTSDTNVNWRFFINNNDIILFAKKIIKLTEGDIVLLPDNYIDNISDEIRYGRKLPKTYSFEEFKIKCGKTVIECLNKNTGNSLWRYSFAAKRKPFGPSNGGWIETEIEYKNGHIIFLTSSRGDIFGFSYWCSLFCIELLTGIIKINGIIVDYKYVWNKDTLFISDGKGNLQQINPFENKIVQKMEFKEGKMSFWSPIKIIGDRLYTVLKNIEGKPIIICIKI